MRRAWVTLLVIAALGAGYLAGRLGSRQPAQRYQPTGAIQEIMAAMVDPSADLIFQSVATITTADGVEERRPRTDEEWAKVEHAALTLAEAANLLRMPGRAVAGAKPGGPDSEFVPELTPEQIQERIDDDRDEWDRHTAALMAQARRAIEASRNRDAEGLLLMGGDLDDVCEQCHLVYWYPNAPQPPALP